MNPVRLCGSTASVSGFARVVIAVAALVYALRLGLPVRRTADAVAPSLALYSSVASIACLEAGCDYGTRHTCPGPWSFSSLAAVPGTPLGVPFHPTQLYAGLVEFVLFVFCCGCCIVLIDDGEILGAWLFLGGLASFLLTSLRGIGQNRFGLSRRSGERR